MQFNRIDASSELQVNRFLNGIKLTKPKINMDNQNVLQDGVYTGQTVSTLLKFPCSIYFDNVHGSIQQLNEHNVELCGFDSSARAIGKKYFSSFHPQTTHLLLKNDHRVMKTEKMEICEENLHQFDYPIKHALSIKMPWYNNQNKIAGLFGFSIILGKNTLADSLALIAKMGLFIPIENLIASIGCEMKGMYLSKQQKLCGQLLLTGISTKEIARRMKLSPRTVESYVDNLKTKFKCHNKTELIIKLYEAMKNEMTL